LEKRYKLAVITDVPNKSYGIGIEQYQETKVLAIGSIYDTESTSRKEAVANGLNIIRGMAGDCDLLVKTVETRKYTGDYKLPENMKIKRERPSSLRNCKDLARDACNRKTNIFETLKEEF
jgi:hypothetical protein